MAIAKEESDMNTHRPVHKTCARFQRKRLHVIGLKAMLAGILMLAIWFANARVEARYQLQVQIGFEVTIPAATN